MRLKLNGFLLFPKLTYCWRPMSDLSAIDDSMARAVNLDGGPSFKL